MWRYFLAKLKRLTVKFFSAFMPGSQARKDFRSKFFLEIYEMPVEKSYYYGKIYMPYYPKFPISKGTPNLYNSEGRKVEWFFLRDRVACDHAYSGSKYFEWDHFNIELDTHFYTHATMLETMGNPKERYGYFYESESIIPHEYNIFKTHKGIEKDFDAIFTYSEELLETLDNAKFFPSCAGIWYGRETFQGNRDTTIMTPEAYLAKSKDISMICSSKKGALMHKLRHHFADEALKTGKVDVFGGYKNGERFDFKSRTLKDYRFQIVIENDIKPYYFTEKIMDCFASMTIPVYIGATKIDKFFNPNGIIFINKDSKIEDILKICTEEEYNNRIEAVKDNYQRSLQYLNMSDKLYEDFLMNRKG